MMSIARHGSTVWGLILSAAFLIASQAGADELARPKVTRLAIVDEAIEYHGGARFSASVSRFDVCSKSGCSAVTVAMDGGLFDYDVVGTVRGAERRVKSSNDSVELWEDGKSVEVDDPERRQSLRDWAMQRVYFNFLPYRLNDPSVYKEDLGVEVWNGRELRKVKVSFEPGTSTDATDEYLYWFDPETRRLELFAYSYEVNGGGLRFRRLFDYRRVGGLLFYNQENWGTEGEGLRVDQVTPEFVESEMRLVSTIELRSLAVEATD